MAVSYVCYDTFKTISGIGRAYASSSGKEEKTVIIRNEYHNYPVIYIGSQCFFHDTAIQLAYIPASITIIGNCAFCGCSHLETLSLPDSFIWIENALDGLFSGGCFGHDDSLSNIDVRLGTSDDWLGTVLRIFDSLSETSEA